MAIKDMRGVEIFAGDVIVYGKSSRYDPIHRGTVVMVGEDFIEVRGKGNSKTGTISMRGDNRVLVLPDDYLEGVE